ncbi:sugar ABC transporter substrate-binding protein [Dermabacteraceae bacterium P13115]
MLIRRKTFLSMAAASGAALTLAACGEEKKAETKGDAKPAEGKQDDKEASPVRDANADLVIWADEKKAASLKEPAAKWGEKNGVKVAVQTVAVDLQPNFITANQAGNGPDILVAAHDWIGNLVRNGAISPVQLPADAATKNAPIGISAVTYENQTYGVPYAVETLALYVNKDLTENEAPKSIEEMIEAAKKGKGGKVAENVLSLPVGEKGDAYHMEPLYTSAGGYLFGEKNGVLDPKDVGVGKEGSINAGEKMSQLGKEGVLKTSITGDNSIALFADGKSAYLVSGPWALADVKKAGINYAVVEIPGFAGMQKAVPFAGVNAFYVASKGKNAGFASQFVNDVASSPEIAEAMFPVNELPPVNLELQQKLAANHPEIVQFAKLAENASPMPAIPAMAEIWGPLGQAESNIVGGADPKSTMESAGKEISSKIK